MSQIKAGQLLCRSAGRWDLTEAELLNHILLNLLIWKQVFITTGNHTADCAHFRLSLNCEGFFVNSVNVCVHMHWIWADVCKCVGVHVNNTVHSIYSVFEAGLCNWHKAHCEGVDACDAIMCVFAPAWIFVLELNIHFDSSKSMFEVATEIQASKRLQ